jgi:hypothetical protein
MDKIVDDAKTPFDEISMGEPERVKSLVDQWRVRITKALLEKYGSTDACQVCRATILGRGAGRSVNHSEKCRSSIEGELEKEDNEQVKRARVRIPEAASESIWNAEEKQIHTPRKKQQF